MLEIASFPPDLNVANPTQSDPTSQGWQHITLVKNVLQNTLPNINAQITATPADLNNILITTRGINTGKTIPIYNSATVASTVPVTDFGLSLLTVNDLAELNSKIDKSGFVRLIGDTMTGALTTPQVNLSSAFQVYVNTNGNPTIQFKSGMAIVANLSNNAIEFYTQGVMNMHLNSAGDLRVRGNIEAFSTFA